MNAEPMLKSVILRSLDIYTDGYTNLATDIYISSTAYPTEGKGLRKGFNAEYSSAVDMVTEHLSRLELAGQTIVYVRHESRKVPKWNVIYVGTERADDMQSNIDVDVIDAVVKSIKGGCHDRP